MELRAGFIVCVCVCVIPSQGVRDGRFNSPLVFSSLALTVRECVHSKQEVNYLELTASRGTHVSQQALPADCLLLSLSLSNCLVLTLSI